MSRPLGLSQAAVKRLRWLAFDDNAESQDRAMATLCRLYYGSDPSAVAFFDREWSKATRRLLNAALRDDDDWEEDGG